MEVITLPSSLKNLSLNTVLTFRLKHTKPLLPNQKGFHMQIKKLLPFPPRNITLYQIAFITRSQSLPSSGKIINNERLEFLGDTVINTIISEHLYRLFPEKNEGELSKFRSRIVNGSSLNDIALKLKLDQLVQYTFHSENQYKHIFGDVFEAFIGALFLDHGYKKTQQYFHQILFKKYIDLPDILKTETDFKSMMLNWAQKNHKKIFFATTENYNAKGIIIFRSLLQTNNSILSEGTGNSKKEAEQKAAQKAWEEIHAAG